MTEATSPACVTVAKTDAMVPYRNSLVYIEALARKGVKVSYLEFEQGRRPMAGTASPIRALSRTQNTA